MRVGLEDVGCTEWWVGLIEVRNHTVASLRGIVTVFVKHDDCDFIQKEIDSGILRPKPFTVQHDLIYEEDVHRSQSYRKYNILEATTALAGTTEIVGAGKRIQAKIT